MLTVVLVRHGITDWNIEQRKQGLADIPLNETGKQQAESLAQRLQRERWDAIYSSDLSRAKRTAEIIAQPLGLTVQTDKRLRERHQGKLEGTVVTDRIDNWGKNWRDLDLGVETDESLSRRGMSFLNFLIEKEDDNYRRILVVSHGGLIGFTVKNLFPEVVEKGGFVSNTSITKLRYDGGHWECDIYNDVAHLPSTSPNRDLSKHDDGQNCTLLDSFKK